MIDLTSASHYGDFYVKGAAFWDDTRPGDVQKRVRFEQADYYWSQDVGKLVYSFRAFANERRFFVEDRIAPLIRDDHVTGDNRGARVDIVWNQLSANALYSVLGDDVDSRKVALVRAQHNSRFVNAVVSYLFDEAGVDVPRSRAIVKAELASGYKWAHALAAYEQAGTRRGGAFVPGGRFDWDAYAVDDLTAGLPDEAALFTELRISPIDLAGRANLKLVYAYRTIGSQFVNDLGVRRGAELDHTAAAYVQAKSVDLNGRLLWTVSERFDNENEDRIRVEASAWGVTRNGLWILARAAIDKIEDAAGDDDHNVVHLGLERRIKEVRSGAHIMWKDLDTEYSSRLFAWDAKFPLSPNWGLYWRAIIGSDFDVADAMYVRLSYRPNNHIFATFGYGRDDIGDAPYLIEDRDVDLARASSAVYVISIRGDF
jgi:hypothetical protein